MTPPLTPPDADLQDFPFMPLHVARLRDSDLAAEAHPEACWYAVLLWAAAWHQLPAGSLPDSDAVLARLCGLGRDLRTFKKHRADALRGWFACDDGRLYHAVVAEQVNSAWAEKLAYRDRKERRAEIARNAAAARWGERPDDESIPDADASRMHDASVADAPSKPDAMLKGRGTGTGSYSDPVGSGAAAPTEPEANPPDPDKIMFDSGRALLGRAGIQPEAAGRLLGKWRQAYGSPAVITALAAAQREGAIEPKSFIEGALRNGNRPRNDRPRSRGLLGAVLDAERDEGARSGV